MKGSKRNRQINLKITFGHVETDRSEKEIIDELIKHVIEKVLAKYRTP
ncbi:MULTISPECIES: hypothetical protein [Brevibacillus]|nr:hypothetical protein [Brevibacillus sp.]